MGIQSEKVDVFNTKGSRAIRLQYFDNVLTTESAVKWARALAKVQFGSFRQKKIKLPQKQLIWVFATNTGFGYIWIAPKERVPDYLRPFVVSETNLSVALFFDSNINWAVLELTFPQLSEKIIEFLKLSTSKEDRLRFARQTILNYHHNDIKKVFGLAVI